MVELADLGTSGGKVTCRPRHIPADYPAPPQPSLLGDRCHHVRPLVPREGPAQSREGCRREHSKDPTKRTSNPHWLWAPGQPLHSAPEPLPGHSGQPGSHGQGEPQGPPDDGWTPNDGAEHPSTMRRHEARGAHDDVGEPGRHGAEREEPRAAWAQSGRSRGHEVTSPETGSTWALRGRGCRLVDPGFLLG